MTTMHNRHSNPVGNIRDYLAGVGWTMGVGAIGMNAMLPSIRDHMAVWQVGLTGVAALWAGWYAVIAWRSFVRSAPTTSRGFLLSLCTAPFALLCGGLFGVMASAVLGKLLYG